MKIKGKIPFEAGVAMAENIIRLGDENEKRRLLLKQAYALLFNVPQFPSQGPRDSHWNVQRDQFLASAEAWIEEPK